METKLKLIELLEQKQIERGIHLRELSRLLKTGLPNVVRYVKLLEKEGVVESRKEVNTIKVKIKEGIRTIAYLKQVNTERFLNLPKKIQIAVNDFLNELEIKPVLGLIFGSYSKKTYNENSDIDILLVYQKVEDEKRIENTAKRISSRTNTKISPVYLDYKSFENNFLDKKDDFSREIRNNVIILTGTEIYYALLWRFLE